MQPAGRIDPPAWMTAPETKAVLAALAAGGAAPRFVGGCVRDAVLGRTGRDIDIATPESPDTVMARLAAAKIHAIPTGVEHGTVTAVIGKRHFEITTLRTDVETYGRRAKVAFIDDWAGDAARRDFTINALYADADGTLYDPAGGLADLAAGRVRFVGRAAERIREDALRILRFFRFFARFGRGEPDREALAACRDAAASLAILSGERVAGELVRLLGTDDPVPAVKLMAEIGVLQRLLPEGDGVARLERLVEIERGLRLADAWRRLAALLPARADAIERVADALRLSNAERARLLASAAPPEPLPVPLDARAARCTIYRIGADIFRDLVLLDWAGGRIADGRTWLELGATWPKPDFPLGGADAKALGMTEGRALGDALRTVESWWVAGDFQADRAACLARLRKEVAGA